MMTLSQSGNELSHENPIKPCTAQEIRLETNVSDMDVDKTRTRDIRMASKEKSIDPLSLY